MPEGVEVKLITEGLWTAISGKRLLSVDILSGRYKRHGDPTGLTTFRQRLPLTCLNVECHGKFIFFTFSSKSGPTFIWNTLGMSGIWSLKHEKHARLAFEFNDVTLYFVDQRNFGTFKFDISEKETAVKLATLGIDFLTSLEHMPSTQLSIKLFQNQKNQIRTLAEVLMNQRNYAGVGNYIKAEALYRAKLSPWRLGSSMSETDIERLHASIWNVMIESYRMQGVTMSNYKTLDERLGTFERRVYSKTHDPDGEMVIRENTNDGRVTHWVPTRQT